MIVIKNLFIIIMLLIAVFFKVLLNLQKLAHLMCWLTG